MRQLWSSIAYYLLAGASVPALAGAWFSYLAIASPVTGAVLGALMGPILLLPGYWARRRRAGRSDDLLERLMTRL